MDENDGLLGPATLIATIESAWASATLNTLYNIPVDWSIPPTMEPP